MNKKKLLKTAAKLATPHLASMVLGKKKSTLSRVMDRAGLAPARSSAGMGSTALKGLGAAAVAVPVGMWLGRMLRDRA